MEYRTIRNPEPVHSLVLAPVKKDQILDAPDAEEKLSKALHVSPQFLDPIHTKNDSNPIGPKKINILFF